MIGPQKIIHRNPGPKIVAAYRLVYQVSAGKISEASSILSIGFARIGEMVVGRKVFELAFFTKTGIYRCVEIASDATRRLEARLSRERTSR